MMQYAPSPEDHMELCLKVCFRGAQEAKRCHQGRSPSTPAHRRKPHHQETPDRLARGAVVETMEVLVQGIRGATALQEEARQTDPQAGAVAGEAVIQEENGQHHLLPEANS